MLYYMTRSLSGQDGAILPARDYPPHPARKILRWPSWLDIGLVLFSVFIDLKSVSIHEYAKKWNLPIPSYLDLTLGQSPYMLPKEWGSDLVTRVSHLFALLERERRAWKMRDVKFSWSLLLSESRCFRDLQATEILSLLSKSGRLTLLELKWSSSGVDYG